MTSKEVIVYQLPNGIIQESMRSSWSNRFVWLILQRCLREVWYINRSVLSARREALLPDCFQTCTCKRRRAAAEIWCTATQGITTGYDKCPSWAKAIIYLKGKGKVFLYQYQRGHWLIKISMIKKLTVFKSKIFWMAVHWPFRPVGWRSRKNKRPGAKSQTLMLPSVKPGWQTTRWSSKALWLGGYHAKQRPTTISSPSFITKCPNNWQWHNKVLWHEPFIIVTQRKFLLSQH